jgi:hypothetical protein
MPTVDQQREGASMNADLNERAFDPAGEVPPAGDAIRQAASETIRAGVDIRARIHDVTLLALRSRRFDRHGMRDVVQAVTAGIALGAEESRADLRKALAESFRGMDEAITRSADASRVALRRLVVAGRDLSDSDVKQGLARMKELENDFLNTAARVAQTAGDKVRPELNNLLEAARMNGTDTGRVAASTLTELTHRFSVASLDVALAGLEAATEVGSRFAQLASGVLSGVADALTEPRKDPPSRT